MQEDLTGFIGAYNDPRVRGQPEGIRLIPVRGLDAPLREYRNSGFVNGFGSRSTRNLACRALRWLKASIPDMVDELEDECIFVNESIG